MAYWRGAAKLLPHLSKIACTRRLRPNGNAAPERFMSIIKNVDSVNARSTKAKTLYNVAFLRANSPIVRLLLKRGANEMLSASERDGLARDAARQAVKEATLQKTLAQLLLAADAAASSDVAAAARGGKKEEEGEEGGGKKRRGERRGRRCSFFRARCAFPLGRGHERSKKFPGAAPPDPAGIPRIGLLRSPKSPSERKPCQRTNKSCRYR